MKVIALILLVPLVLLAQIPPLERSRAKNSYLLDDEFSDVKAAGAVNGTFAVPGPGLRTVTDTESKLTISGGNLVFSGGKAAPAFGDPGLWYQLISVNQFTFIGKLSRSSGHTQFSFDSDQSGSGMYSLYFNNTNVTLNGSVVNRLADQIVGTYSYPALVYTANNIYYYYKDGNTYNNYILLYQIVNTSSAKYPAVINYSGVINFNFFRIPTALLTVRPLAYTAFTGANGTALTQSDATSADGYGINPIAWGVSGWYITNNTATCLANGTNFINTVQSSGADVLCSVNLTNSTGNCGLTLRANDANQTNCILVYYNGTAVKASVLTNSVEYNIATVVTAYSAGARLVTRIYDDHKLWVWYNEALVTGAPFDLSSYTTLKTGTNHGLFNTSSANRLDNWNCYPKNDATVVSYLNKYSGDNP